MIKELLISTKNLVLEKREILEEENHGNLINLITINYKHKKRVVFTNNFIRY